MGHAVCRVHGDATVLAAARRFLKTGRALPPAHNSDSLDRRNGGASAISSADFYALLMPVITRTPRTNVTCNFHRFATPCCFLLGFANDVVPFSKEHAQLIPLHAAGKNLIRNECLAFSGNKFYPVNPRIAQFYRVSLI